VVVAGSEHDLRLIRKRLSKETAKGARPADSWLDIDRGWGNRVKLLEMQLERGWRDADRLVISAADVLRSNAGLAAARR